MRLGSGVKTGKFEKCCWGGRKKDEGEIGQGSARKEICRAIALRRGSLWQRSAKGEELRNSEDAEKRNRKRKSILGDETEVNSQFTGNRLDGRPQKNGNSGRPRKRGLGREGP